MPSPTSSHHHPTAVNNQLPVLLFNPVKTTRWRAPASFHHRTLTRPHSTFHTANFQFSPARNRRGKPAGRRARALRANEDDDGDELRARGGGGDAAAALGGGERDGPGAGAGGHDLRRLRGGRRQQQRAGHAGARQLPALRPRLPGHARAHRPLLQRQARHRLHRGEPGPELVPAGVPEPGGAERQQEPPARRQLRLRRRRLPRRHGRGLRRHLADTAGGVLQGVPVAGGGVGRRAARQGAHVGVHLRRQRRRQRLRAELLRQPRARRRLHARPVRRRAHAALHRLRRGPVQPGRPPDRRDVAAADGLPPGVHHAVRRRQRELRGAPQQRLPDLQPEAGRGRGRRDEAAPGPQARRLRYLPAAARPHRQPHRRRVL